MADGTFDKLVVSDSVGIGTDTPNAQLHVNADVNESKVLVESGSNVFKVSVDGAGATIGTISPVPLSIQTDGTTRVFLAPNGNVGINKVTPTFRLDVDGIVNATGLHKNGVPWKLQTGDLEDNAIASAKIVDLNVTEAKLANNAVTTAKIADGAIVSTKLASATITADKIADATITAAKLAPGTLSSSQWVNGTGGAIVYTGGNVGIGTATPQAKLEVKGAIWAGSSDIYFTDVNHNHTGIGNTVGFAAIENAANYTALMILGRAGTPKGRYVRLWDYLQVNGGLDITGNVGIGTDSPDRKLVVRGGETSLQQEDWQTPTLQNGWVNYGNSFNPAGYFKDSLGIIHLRGLVKNGNGTIFTLPEGYRPANRELHGVCTHPNTSGRIDILTDGQVWMEQGNNAWISLDGITFRAGSRRPFFIRPEDLIRPGVW